MVTRKEKGPRADNRSERRISTPRTASYTRLLRVDEAASGAGAPSTLPPPPFESETSVEGLEWWLDAHMGLASGLLWLEQLLETVPESDSRADTVRRLAAGTETVRDALYELYCDAADGRVAPLLGPEAALEAHVRGSYAWCVRVVGLLATVTNGLRAPSRPEWAMAKAEFRAADEAYPTGSETVREGVRSLAIDFTSPIEPLRNLPRDLEHLFDALGALRGMLAQRFA